MHSLTYAAHLPIRSMPYAEESLLGYLKRHAGVIGMPTVAAFGGQFGLPADVRSIPTSDISGLVAALGDMGTCLEGMRYVRGEKSVLIRGHILSRHYLDTFSMRWCPACLSEGEYHRECWNLAFVKVCPLHRVRLLQACPSCSSRARWSRPGLYSCTCGTELASMTAIGCSDQAGDAAEFLMRAFYACADSWRCPAVLSGLPLEETIDFISLLGRMACEARDIAPGSGRPMTWAHADEVIGEGYRVALGWPQSFEALLDSLSRGYSDQACNLKDIFGACYAAMRRAPLQSYGAAIRSVLTPYCYERFGISVDDYRPQQSDSRRSSLEDARLALGVSPHGFRRFKKQLSLQRKGRQKFVVGSEIEQMIEASAQVCNGKTMGQLLGLHVKKQLKEILDSQIFATAMDSGDRRARSANRIKVEALLTHLEFAVKKHGLAANHGDLASWAQLRRMASQRQICLPALIQLMIVHKLEPAWGSISKGLPGLSFDRVSALDTLNEAASEGRNSAQTSNDTMSSISA